MQLFRRKSAEEAAEEPPPEVPRAPRPRRLPNAGVLRRERKALLRRREEQIRDVGGLALEMYRRASFREDLLGEQCAEVIATEERIHEVDALIAAARGRGPSARCACGAPILWGSHFCANCGRPAAERPVVACASCGRALPADVQFCGFCGAPAEPVDLDATMAGRAQPQPEPEPERDADAEAGAAEPVEVR